MTTYKRRTPEAAQKAADKAKEKATALQSQLTEKLAEVLESGDWLSWLKVQAQFHHYSFNNTMLILMQRPLATHVMGYGNKDHTTGWLSLNRQVIKGEKGIEIFAPSFKRFYLKDGQKVPDWLFNAGRTMVDDKGREYVPYTTFVVVHVFDISQTEGEPLPAKPEVFKASLLEGELPEDLWNQMEKTLTEDGYAVELSDQLGKANGDTSFLTHTVRVNQDRSGLQRMKTLIHEWAHTNLHEDVNYMGDRGRWECEAESVAYIVMNAAGFDSADYSFGYITDWADGKIETIRDTATRVVKAAQTLLDQLGIE